MQELSGTPLSADINLVAQILMLAGLWLGFYFARIKQITRHANIQTGVVLTQLGFIFVVMLTSFYDYVIAGGTTGDTVARLMIGHGFLGLFAELSGIYLILRMRTELVPQALRVRNFKLVMRSTLALWTVVALLGIGIYYYRFLVPQTVIVTAPITQLGAAGEDLVLHVVELQKAVDRGNLQTSKRHAEHLVNLIEGNNGDHYGDLDGDGSVEDPGDGTGLLNYLAAIQDATEEQDIIALTETVREWLEQIDAFAVSVRQAVDLTSVANRMAEHEAVVFRVLGDGIAQIQAKADAVGLRRSTVVIPQMPGPTGEGRTATVVMEQIQFIERTITVPQGWTVEFINRERPKHTVTFDDGTFTSASITQGGRATFTFHWPGTFPYYCRFHGDKNGVGMAGTVIVEPPSQ